MQITMTPDSPEIIPLPIAMRNFEKKFLKKVIKREGFDGYHVAERLGISVSQLRTKSKSYKLDVSFKTKS